MIRVCISKKDMIWILIDIIQKPKTYFILKFKKMAKDQSLSLSLTLPTHQLLQYH